MRIEKLKLRDIIRICDLFEPLGNNINHKVTQSEIHNHKIIH